MQAALSAIRLDVLEALWSASREGVQLLGEFMAQGPCMVGVARFSPGSTDGRWERHDGGDELIYVLRGRVVFTADQAGSPQTEISLGPGQAAFIPRGVGHTGRVLEELDVFFLTPRDSTVLWREGGAVPPHRPAPAP